MPQATTSEEQTFLNYLDKKLWNAADRLRANLDAAVYKHAVLELNGPGSVSHEVIAGEPYEDLDVRRREQDALEADAEDLKAI